MNDIMTSGVRAVALAALLAVGGTANGQQAGGLAAFHRAGQTFLTWDEVTTVAGERYRVYRHDQPITSGNLGQARRVADIDDATSAFTNERGHPTPIQQNFIIQGLGPELSDDTGLFVFTARQSGASYYAVTVVISGIENVAISAANAVGPVAETVADPEPVLVWVSPSGYGRVYTQFMDYADWNPTFEGYAYNYAVAVPAGYSGQQLAATIVLTGYGNRYAQDPETPYQAPTVWINIDEPNQTWYYGFASGWDYAQGEPRSGTIRNYAEERILRALYDTLREAYYNVDPDRIYAFGHSMGGSGAYNLGLRYPQVFAAAYSDEGMTDYGAAANWSWDLEPKWGTVARNLPVESHGRYAQPLQRYDGTGVYDWMNHQQMMIARRGDEMAYVACDHGSNDTTIDWPSQGRAWYGILQQGRRAFAGEVTTGGHTWQNFVGLPPNWDFYSYDFRNHESFPAFSYSSANSPVDPGGYGTTAAYNQTLEWSCSWHTFAGAIIDTPTHFEMALRSTASAQTTDVTPRRLQSLVHAPGTVVDWQVTSLGGSVLQSGTVTADADGLITVPSVAVSTVGVRLVLDAQATPPDDVLVAPGPGDPNPPRVKGYTGAGAPIAALDFDAYGVAKWGANVGAGNIDTAGGDEVLTGPGPGSVFGPQVRAFSRTSAPVAKVNFYAYGTLRFGVGVAAASLDADGPAELLTGAGPGAVFGPHVRGFNYDGATVAAIAKVSFFAFGTLKYGVNAGAGRIDGDAFDELLAGAGPGAVFGAQVRGFDYDGATVRSIGAVNAFVFASTQYGASVAGGDADGDAFAEILAGKGPGPSNDARLKLLDYDGVALGEVPNGETVAFAGALYGVYVGAAEVDGDGIDEVLAGSGASPAYASTLAAFDYQAGLQPIGALGLAPYTGLAYGLKPASGDLGY